MNPYMSAREIALTNTLRRVCELATRCQSDMQGRLSDSEHRRAFDVLGAIVEQAGSVKDNIQSTIDLEKENIQLREALEPFARLADKWPDADDFSACMTVIIHCRNAKKALQENY